MNITSDKKSVQIIVDVCARKGMKQVVISPGSRNAPLSISFNRDERIECFVIVDERSAAFFALGLAQMSGLPVGLVCTSGTALLNYAPAVCEAFYQRIPLVVLSADRPVEWIDQDDSQAIQQQNIFSNFVKKSCQLPAEVACDADAWYVNRNVNEAINLSVSGRKGPVHINIPLREPLYRLSERGTQPERIIECYEPEGKLPASRLEELKARTGGFDKILVLCGFMPKQNREDEPAIWQQTVENGQVVVLAEPISNAACRDAITTIDRVLNTIGPDEAEAFRPDLVISCGGALVSKQIKTFLKNNPPREHWYVGRGESHIDTLTCLTALIQCEPLTLLQEIFPVKGGDSRYSLRWKEKAVVAEKRHNGYLASAPWSDLKAFEILTPALPAPCNLQLGNSSAVRYGHLFPLSNAATIYSNRGTSGIDGSTSTAAGAACNSELPTVFISGDISFFYDSNGLWNKYLSPNLRIIVMKNGGGSLFRFIPGPSEVEELDDYFEAAQDLNIGKMAELYDLPFYRAANAEELKDILPRFFAPHAKAAVLEICTPRTENDVVLRGYFGELRVGAALVAAR